MDGTEGTSHTGLRTGSSSASDEPRAAAEAARRRVRIMLATVQPTLPRSRPAAAPAARLALKSDGAAPGLLDGAWWPRSRDLLSELPSLTAVLDPLWGRITRVAVNPTYWPDIPRKVPVDGHVVKAGWFTELDPHKLLLLSYGNGRRDLLIIPPETGAEAAARLMAAASAHDGPPLTASALIAADEGRDEGRSGAAATVVNDFPVHD
ncbi:DUF5994 family protein [Streptomyces sp. NPDC001100]